MAVDEPYVRVRQVGQGLDPFGVAFGDDQALLADDQRHDDAGGQQLLFFEVGQIVGAGRRVEQMRADDVRFAALECNEPAQRADVAGRDLEPRGLGAELVVEHADAQVVAAGEQDGVVHLVERPE